jgi:hypothetical protein
MAATNQNFIYEGIKLTATIVGIEQNLSFPAAI